MFILVLSVWARHVCECQGDIYVCVLILSCFVLFCFVLLGGLFVLYVWFVALFVCLFLVVFFGVFVVVFLFVWQSCRGRDSRLNK